MSFVSQHYKKYKKINT